ncbi:MAG TPA: PGPGW domain-containing protein [Syntrophales bacterium]|nr:PGPGW domain-containing protein [Syntrophales bacterium]
MKKVILKSIRQAKRLVIAVVGFTVLLIGFAMIILPGPAVIVIPIGLGILATEFVWARRLLRKVKAKIREAAKDGDVKNG